MPDAFQQQLVDLSATGLSLSASVNLGPEVQLKIEKIQQRRITVEEGAHVVRRGDYLDQCYVVRSGWLARQKNDVHGTRRTANVFLPGDLFAVHLNFKRRSQFDIVAIVPAEIAVISARELQTLAREDPIIEAALDWNATRSFNIVSEHVIGMSTRTAAQRIVHLFLEFWCRLIVVGQASENAFDLPLTQAEIGEMAGLSIVTVNRSIQELRRSDFITIQNRRVVFTDIRAAMNYAEFDPSFLGLFEPAFDYPEIEESASPLRAG